MLSTVLHLPLLYLASTTVLRWNQNDPGCGSSSIQFGAESCITLVRSTRQSSEHLDAASRLPVSCCAWQHYVCHDWGITARGHRFLVDDSWTSSGWLRRRSHGCCSQLLLHVHTSGRTQHLPHYCLCCTSHRLYRWTCQVIVSKRLPATFKEGL